jgi:membrane protease subunit HflC
MKKHMGLFLIALAVVVGLLAVTVFYRVDQLRDVVLIKTFGKVGQPLWGKTDAGLHVKFPWPIQRLVRYDARSQVFDDTHVQVQTSDKQNILVTLYCMWRLEDPVRFQQALESFEAAEQRLKSRLRYYKGTVVGQYPLSAFINTDPGQMKLSRLEAQILQPLRAEALADYGIEIQQVGVSRVGLPESISQSVIELQMKERQRYVNEYLARGEAQARTIEARAEAARKEILAFAERLASEIETKGYREAARLYADFQQAPDLAIFLREIESIRKQFARNTVFILDGTLVRPVRYFRDRVENLIGTAETAPAPATRPAETD